MSESMDTQQALDAVKATTTVMKECLDAGMYLGKKCFKEVAIFVQLGLAVRTVIGFTEPGQKDPVLKEIGELSDKLDKIEEKIKENFDDLKAFISQYSFYNDVPLAGALLSQYMHKAVREPSAVTRDLFMETYGEFPPLEYARRLNHQLSKTTTNPLKMLIAADPSKGQETFDKWHKNYESVLTQLVIAEATACHLFNNNEKHNLEKLDEEFKRFEKSVEQWRHEYESDTSYWPKMASTIMEEIQNKNSNKTNDEKAEMIREKLEAILTSDVLTVIVISKSDNCAFYLNTNEHLRISWNHGGTHAFVYRSRLALAEAENVKQFQKNVEILKGTKLETSRSEGFYNESKLKSKTSGLMRESGFVIMVKHGETVGIRSTKSFRVKDGGGGHFHGKLQVPGDSSHDVPFFLFAGFK